MKCLKSIFCFLPASRKDELLDRTVCTHTHTHTHTDKQNYVPSPDFSAFNNFLFLLPVFSASVIVFVISLCHCDCRCRCTCGYVMCFNTGCESPNIALFRPHRATGVAPIALFRPHTGGARRAKFPLEGLLTVLANTVAVEICGAGHSLTFRDSIV